KLLTRPETPAPVVARTLLLLRSKSANVPPATLAAAGKRLLAAADRGEVRLDSPAAAALYLEFLEVEGATDAGLKQLGRQLTDGQGEAKPLAHALARKFGPKAAPLADALRPRLLDPKARPEDRVELLATLARIDAAPDPAWWAKVLADPNPGVRTEAVR